MSDIDKGSRVVVVKGRKAVGTMGTVFWIGDNKWGEGKRLGIEGDDGQTHWIAMSNVELTDQQPPEIEPPSKGDMVAWTVDEQELTGTVFWVGESKSGRGYRVGVKDDAEETHWLDARQVTVRAGGPSDEDEEVPF